MMTLTDAQKAQVGAWLREGLPLAEVQNRLARELGASLTYLELKLLVSELNVLPKDREAKAAPVDLGAAPGAAAPARPAPATPPAVSARPPAASSPPTTPAAVSVAVDNVTRPGAMVSGSVTFSDGQRAAWYVDEMGRLSVAASQPGYRPPPGDMQQFQSALEQELARAGF